MYIHIFVYMCVIMTTMCLPGYYHYGFVATHALWHMTYGCA